MSLMPEQLEHLLQMAKEAALAAGDIIARYQGTEIATELKTGGDSLASQVVTEVDKQAEQAILKILQPTLAQYDLGLLTEETTDDESRFQKDHFWCIDPLDGTLPFTQNLAGYSTAIALVNRAGQPVLGVINDPRNNLLYTAITSAGAYKNGQPFRVLKSDKAVTVDNGPGGAVLQAIATIESAPSVFYKKPKKETGGGCLWDYAASSIIHTEAGGQNSDYHLRPLNLNSDVSVFMNHVGVCFFAGLSEEAVKAYLINEN